MSDSADLDLIDGIIYADAFDCAVSLEEVCKYSRVRISLPDMRERLARAPLREMVGERGGYYFLHGREDLVTQRISRRGRALRLKQRARSVARWLQHAPFVRGLVLTGSVAAEDALSDADIDMLIIVAHHRISLAFLLLGGISRLLSRRLFCPNYYLSAAHLALTRRDYYVARELSQAVALTETTQALFDANPWTQEVLPNGRAADAPVR
ncbi:MAG TPA: nucleotidyltransferase domain-containing protein, partial [Candidatus Binataceae bacterium]|nr:nucleotidyltransferase domain-containing protein [Candidatus Binataceae bacterium]